MKGRRPHLPGMLITWPDNWKQFGKKYRRRRHSCVYSMPRHVAACIQARGAQILLYLVKQDFWPLGGRNIARKVDHNCIVCYGNKPRNFEQIMENWP
ncbi:hypothetical protein TNCV_4085011 [Trichonephila clavipes]|nr:hypothetical protein TNCV_4085011 [Trichonephila clavipes]